MQVDPRLADLGFLKAFSALDTLNSMNRLIIYLEDGVSMK